MTFEELKNGMKDLFSSLGAKTSDSNYAVGLFDKTSAEPKGIMDFASLAKELGALPVLLQKALSWWIDIAGGTDIDSLGAGLYGGIGWQLNGTAVAGFLICIGNAQWKAQIAILYGSATPNQIKSRTYNNGWTAWKDL